MSLFGVGPLEFIFLLLIAILIFNPEELATAGRKLGRFLYKVKNSDFWHSIVEMRKKASETGKQLIQESGIDEVQQEFENFSDLDDFRKELDQMGFIPNKERVSSTADLSVGTNVEKSVIEK